MKDNGRRLVGLGDVVWKVTQSGGNSKMIPVFMVLFDDILVILSKKAGKYVFAMPVSFNVLFTYMAHFYRNNRYCHVLR